jgi:RNA polymerase sigma factor (sigma-70 family)
MGKRPVGAVLSYLRTAGARPEDAADQELLRRFRDERHELAFAELVRRHGPMVLGVCRRLLGADDAEDAFQAVFLVLVRKAGSLGREAVLAHWLHGVAYRTALHARGEIARRRAREKQEVPMAAADPLADLEWRDLRPILDEEVQRLPQRYRAPVILCYLEGQSYEEAARQLGCPKGTVAARLARARERLRAALTGRSVTLSTAGLAALLAERSEAAVSAGLAGTTVRAALATATGQLGVVPARAAALAAGVLKGLSLGKSVFMATLVLLGAVMACALAGQAGDPEGRSQAVPPPIPQQAKGDAAPPADKKAKAPAQPGPLLKVYKHKEIHAEAGFTPAKTEAVLGEPLPVTFSVKNLGDKEFGYWWGGDYRGTGRHDRFKIEAREASGKLLRDPKARPDGTILDMGGLGGVYSVKPGETKTQDIELTHYRTFERSGEYTVTCRFAIQPGDNTLVVREETAFTVETTFRLKLLPRTEENVTRVLRQLIAKARADKSEALTQTVGVICSFGRERAIPDLVAMAGAGDLEHRRAALGGLGRFTTPAAVQAVLKGLQDPENPIREAAASALGEMKTEAAIDGLLAALPKEKPAVAAAVLPALGRTGSPRVFEPLVKALDHEDVSLRRAAVAGLAALGGKDALAALKRCTADADLGRREAVVKALVGPFYQTLDPEWLFPLIRAGKNHPQGGWDPEGAVNLLRWYGGAKSLPNLIRCLDFKDPAPRTRFPSVIFTDLIYQHKALKVTWHHQPKTPQELEENRRTLRRLKAWLVEHNGGGKPPDVREVEPALPARRPDMTPEIAALVKGLGSKKFAEREAAGQALVKLGEEALPAVRWTAARGEDLETRRRAAALVEAIGRRWEVRSLTGHTDAVTSVALSRDGKRALSGGKDGGLRLWDLATGKELHRFESRSAPVQAVALAPDGGRALSASADGVVRLWDVRTGRSLLALKEGHLGAVGAVAFCPDGRRALSGGDDATIRLWDLEKGKELRRLLGHTDGVSSLAVTPDGRQVLSAGLDGTLRLWDLESGKELRTFRGHHDAVWAVALLPGGRRAVSASCDRTLRVWDLDSGAELRRLTGHADSVYGVAVTPDGRRAVSCGHDGTARAWDLDTGKELRRFLLHADRAEGIAVTPDGTQALTAVSDRTVRVLRLPP